MEILFCTIVTKYRLYQCIALYNSLRKFMPEAILEVLCMDEDSNKLLERAGLPGIRRIPLELLENKELRIVKENRSLGEYCWTMKPVLLQYLFSKYRSFEVITYLDADLYFFDSPMKLFEDNRNWNVMVSTHKVNRKVNSGFVAFHRTKTTNKILKWWSRKCLDWCYARKEADMFGDQGHLDSMRQLFSGIKYLRTPGANIAPWNCFNYDFSSKEGRVYIGRCPLIFFHFSGFHLRRLGLSAYAYESNIPCEICSVYCKELIKVIDYIRSIDSEMEENFLLGM